MNNAIAISVGAILGAFSRYYLSLAISNTFGANYAYQATFIVNITGSFLIALILTWAIEINPRFSISLRLLLTTGFCGSYTTFSTYSLEIATFIQQNNWKLAFNYSFASMLLGLLALYFGVSAARWLANVKII
jgi:CrcB protein